MQCYDIFRKSYLLPMENFQAQENQKLLQTSLLNEMVCNSLWKTFSRNLIYCAIRLTAKPPSILLGNVGDSISQHLTEYILIHLSRW